MSLLNQWLRSNWINGPHPFKSFGIHDFMIPLQTILIHNFTHPLQQYVAFRDFRSFNAKRPGSLCSELPKFRTPICRNLSRFRDPTLLLQRFRGFAFLDSMNPVAPIPCPLILPVSEVPKCRILKFWSSFS
jgi:hypothetical protein